MSRDYFRPPVVPHLLENRLENRVERNAPSANGFSWPDSDARELLSDTFAERSRSTQTGGHGRTAWSSLKTNDNVRRSVIKHALRDLRDLFRRVYAELSESFTGYVKNERTKGEKTDRIWKVFREHFRRLD